MNATVDQLSFFAEPVTATSGVMAHKGYPLQLGWLEKAVALVDQSSASLPLSPSSNEEMGLAMIQLGVGSSMIPALRHWSYAANLVETTGDAERLTEFARTMTTIDPYFEETGSLWLIHWKIATQPEVSVHSWFFNHFFQRRFTKHDLVAAFCKYTTETRLRVSENQAARDVDCFLKNYSSSSGQQNEEPFSTVILRDLGLMHCTGKKSEIMYTVDDGHRDSLPDSVFVVALIEFWHRHFRNQKTMAFDNLLNSSGSPGLVFRLSQQALCDRIELATEALHGKLHWTDTQGLRQLQCIDIESLYFNRYQYI